MNEHHVTSLELSKKLKEAGVEQKSEFYWMGIVNIYGEISWEIHQRNDDIDFDWGAEKWLSAFLASELAEMLPERISHRRCLYITPTPEELRPYENNWYVLYERASTFFDENTGNPETGAPTLPDALGEMVLYLKQNNLLKEASV